ncbi:hypothetical protein FKM82_007335 [Ascaphus truei]
MQPKKIVALLTAFFVFVECLNRRACSNPNRKTGNEWCRTAKKNSTRQDSSILILDMQDSSEILYFKIRKALKKLGLCHLPITLGFKRLDWAVSSMTY